MLCLFVGLSRTVSIKAFELQAFRLQRAGAKDDREPKWEGGLGRGAFLPCTLSLFIFPYSFIFPLFIYPRPLKTNPTLTRPNKQVHPIWWVNDSPCLQAKFHR